MSDNLVFDYDNLPEGQEMERIINALGPEDIMLLINKGRERIYADPEKEVPAEEIRARFLLARRLRALRENKKTKAPVEKKKKETGMSLDGLIGLMQPKEE